MIFKRYISPLAMVATLTLVYGIDNWLDYQEKIAFNTNSYTPLLAWTLVSRMFLIVVWLALYWITFVWAQRDVRVGVFHLIVGFVIVIYPATQMFVPGLPFLFTSYDTSLSYTGIFFSLLGILLLLQPIPSSVDS